MSGPSPDDMESELDAIQRRLAELKRRLDERKSVYAIEDEMARGDVLAMNPLTAGEPDEPPRSGA